MPGNEGLLQNGGVQWMTAGRGIIHSEMPEQEDGVMEGFQLWLNLPARRKMIPAWYRDIPSAEIPEYRHSGRRDGARDRGDQQRGRRRDDARGYRAAVHRHRPAGRAARSRRPFRRGTTPSSMSTAARSR